jgi:hypothetical protein
MSGPDPRTLIEAAVTAFRERDREGRIVPPPAWWDLAPEALDTLYAEQAIARDLERAMDPAGESGTVKAVMARLRDGI